MDAKTVFFLFVVFFAPFLLAFLLAVQGKANDTSTPLIGLVVCVGAGVGYVWSTFDELDVTAKGIAPLGVVFYSFWSGLAFGSGLGAGLVTKKLTAIWRGRSGSRNRAE